MSKVIVNSANTKPNNPIDIIVGSTAIVIIKPSLKFNQIFFGTLIASSVTSIACFQAIFNRSFFTIVSGFPSCPLYSSSLILLNDQVLTVIAVTENVTTRVTQK